MTRLLQDWAPWFFMAITSLVVGISWPLPMSHPWVWMLLAWGMVLWIPLAVKLTSGNPRLALWMSATGLLACLIADGASHLGALSTLPYLAMLSLKAFETWSSACWKLTSNGISDLYLWVGGFHLFAWAAGGLGLPFSNDIILLTALHFHFAGFLITWTFQRWMLQMPALQFQLWVHLGLMSATALGILWTSWSGQPYLEAMAGLLTSLNIMLAVSRYTFHTRLSAKGILLWAVLMSSMSLAAAYALRTWWPLEFLSIPFMRATHGTLNALLFPVLILFPYLTFRSPSPQPSSINEES